MHAGFTLFTGHGDRGAGTLAHTLEEAHFVCARGGISSEVTRVVYIAQPTVYNVQRLFVQWFSVGYHSPHAPLDHLQQSARTTITALTIRNAAGMEDVMGTSVNVVRGPFETRYSSGSCVAYHVEHDREVIWGYCTDMFAPSFQIVRCMYARPALTRS